MRLTNLKHKLVDDQKHTFCVPFPQFLQLAVSLTYTNSHKTPLTLKKRNEKEKKIKKLAAAYVRMFLAKACLRGKL